MRQPEREEIRGSIALPVQTSLRIHELRQGHDLDFLGQRKALLAGIHDATFIDFQVRQRDAHGRREDGRVRSPRCVESASFEAPFVRRFAQAAAATNTRR